MHTFQFPVIEAPHLATIKNKTRNSGLTSVCFIDETRLLCADFNEKRAYLTALTDGEVEIIDTHPTVIADGTAVETDLMDYKDGRFVVSNFYQGSVSVYRVANDKIVFDREVNLDGYKYLHGVRFIPGHDGLVWLTFCGANNRCHQIVDLDAEEIIHQIDTDQQCQDVAFVDDYAVVFARTDHIKGGKRKAIPLTRKWWMYATAYVYRMPADLRTEAPAFVSRWKGEGHIDACKAYEGKIYAANQYLDRVDVFSLSDAGELKLVDALTGFGMPHGLDARNGTLAVTNYNDQTLRMVPV